GCSGEATADGTAADATSAPSVTAGLGEGATSEGDPEPADADTFAGEGLCAHVDGIGEELQIANYTNDGSSDPQGYVDSDAAAAEGFASVEPPADIADSWAVVANFFTTTHSYLDGIDATQPNAISDALTFDSEEPDAFTMVIQ